MSDWPRPSTRLLLALGIAYSAWYVISNDVVAASFYDGYSRLDQAVSELSATSAPTKTFLASAIPFSTALLVAFGVGVWRVAGRARMLRITAAAFVVQAATFPIWVLFPMTSREAMASTDLAANDVGHIALTALTVALIVTQVIAGAIAVRERRFRIFSGAMALITLVFGAMTGVLSADIASGGPTPWMGLIERISIGAWLLWIAVLAMLLLRQTSRVLISERRS